MGGWSWDAEAMGRGMCMGGDIMEHLGVSLWMDNTNVTIIVSFV